MKRIMTIIVAVPMIAALAAGCGLNKAQQGAVIGAGAGGAAGAVVGNQTGSTVRGAIIGAVVGGAAGAIIGHQMDRQADELRYEIPGAVVTRVGEGITITFPEGSLFATNSDQLLPTARDNMRRFAASLVKYPSTRAMIVGHTDGTGSTDYNTALSVRRAQSAASFLTTEGVTSARITAVGRGEAEPLATNDTDAGRQLNRRVEVAIFADDAARAGN